MPASDKPDRASAAGTDRVGATPLPWLVAVDRAIGRIEQGLLAIFLIVLVAVGAGQAVSTLLGTSWMWSEEIIRYSVFFIAMTGAALSAHTEQLIAMDFVTRLLRARRRAQLKLLLRLFTAAMCVVLIITSLKLRAQTGAESYHVIPASLGLLALPIGTGLVAFHVLVHLAVDLAYLLRGETPPDANRVSVH
ncbi:MAG: TRAP transporter small permease subunit [Myxococcota bacterium]